ncbi:MAG: hypothetical protein Aurels2KO_21220 [Aureliella sp.]
MVSWIESFAVRVASHLGFALTRESKSMLRRSIPDGAKLYVGCGEHELEGYAGCDLRALPNVRLVCKAWEVSRFCEGLSEIYSRHMLEHLTLRESQLTLADWFQALAPGGEVRIEVPNLDFVLRQWGRAKWNEEELAGKFSDARWGFAGLFGWQRECDPESPEYNQSYWDVHKSGYTQESIRFFLEQAGFVNIKMRLGGFTKEQNMRRGLDPSASEGCHLFASAQRPSVVSRVAA